MFTALRGANQITELYPKEFEQGCCQKHERKMNTTRSPLTKLFVCPVKGMQMGPLISSCLTEKARYFATLKLMTGLLGKPHITQCQGINYFLGGIAKKLQQNRCAGVVY
jgi:hypothetical protein